MAPSAMIVGLGRTLHRAADGAIMASRVRATPATIVGLGPNVSSDDRGPRRWRLAWSGRVVVSGQFHEAAFERAGRIWRSGPICTCRSRLSTTRSAERLNGGMRLESVMAGSGEHFSVQGICGAERARTRPRRGPLVGGSPCESGGPEESHLGAPTERSVTVSRHSALLIETVRTRASTPSARTGRVLDRQARSTMPGSV